MHVQLQAYDMDQRQQVWEQELYNEMVYQPRYKWFHSFEADEHVAGICFADEHEADDFLDAVRCIKCFM